MTYLISSPVSAALGQVLYIHDVLFSLLLKPVCTPNSAAETNLILNINKRVEVLIYAQKIRIFGLAIHLTHF